MCLIRTYAVSKSSTAGSGRRPTASEHYDSLEVIRDLIEPARILIVDDVITMGATLVACTARVKEAFPNSAVKSFAVLRTKGFVDEIDSVLNPVTSEIKFYTSSGKVWREDPD